LASGFNVTCAQPVAADIGSIPGSNGQLLFNNSGAIGAEDPVISYNNPSETTAAWTSATANNTVLSVTLPVGTGVLSTVMVTLNQGSTITGGAVAFLASDTIGLTNTYPVYCIVQGAGTGPVSSYTLTATTNIAFQCSLSSFEAFEVKLSPAISGTGTVNVGIQPTSAPSQAQVAVVNFPATQPISAASLPLPSGAAVSASQCGGANSTAPCEVSATTAANGATNPLFVEPTDGTNAMGAMANYGTAPGAVKALNANVAVTNTPNVNIQANASTNWAQTNGSTVTLATGNVPLVGIEGHAGAAVDGAPGSAVPANAVQVGGSDGTNTRVEYMDPCDFNAWTYYVVNVSSNTQIIAGSATKNVWICKEFIQPVAAAANVELVESATSGNACATSPTGMMGGATAATGGTIAANGGFVLPADKRAWAKTATSGDAVCIFVSAATTGVIAYVQF
jgi:hypothetical protein